MCVSNGGIKLWLRLETSNSRDSNRFSNRMSVPSLGLGSQAVTAERRQTIDSDVAVHILCSASGLPCLQRCYIQRIISLPYTIASLDAFDICSSQCIFCFKLTQEVTWIVMDHVISCFTRRPVSHHDLSGATSAVPNEVCHNEY